MIIITLSIAAAFLALAVKVVFFTRKDTTDMRREFFLISDAHAFYAEMDEAGYDCWISPVGENWEVRCYKRDKGVVA